MSDKVKRDLTSLKSKVGNLLTPAEIAAQIRAISHDNPSASSTPQTSEENAAEPTLGPSYRKKYTTMLAPELILKLKSTALQQGISAADLLEKILLEHL